MKKLFLCVVFTGMAASLTAQSSTTAQAAKKPAQPSKPLAQPEKPLTQPEKPLTLTGCVGVDETNASLFKLSDVKTGNTYQLTGANVKSYVWRNVRIVGGLVPSANIAAQAGSIDPTKAAVASEGASSAGAGPVQPPEFNVVRVQPLSGSCPPKSK